MGSLRKIMNVDDDHVDSHSIRRDRRTASRSSIDQDPSISMPRYTIPLSISNSQLSTQGQRLASPPHALHSSPSPIGYTIPTGSRRRSNTSTDSMDSSYGHGYGQSNSHTNSLSGVPMRPSMSGNGAGEAPVKLTPITGRVSRAKKGVPVHTCEICRPPKTFTRAEHLRRHQLSHQPPELACTVPGCEKVFHRKDLLERHLQRHEQDDNMTKDGGQSSRRSYGSPNQRYGNSPPMLQMPSAFDGSPAGAGAATASTVQEISMASSHWSSVGQSTARGNPVSSPHMRDAQDAYQMGGMKHEYIADSVAGIQSSNTTLVSDYDEPRSDTGLGVMNPAPNLCMPDAVSSSLPWTDSAGIPSSSSGSTYSTSPPDNSRYHQPPTRTSSVEWNGQVSSYTSVSREMQSPIITSGSYDLSFAYATTPPEVYPSVYGEGMGLPLPGYEDSNSLYGPHHILATTARSISPQLIMGQSSETLVTAPSALPSDRLMYPRTYGREPVDVLGLFTAQYPMPVTLSREARGAIPAYLEVYWDKVHSMYPIIHKPTFEDASNMIPEHLDILQCAMTAIATQFLEHEEHHNNGHQLHAYAWDKSKLYTNTQEWPLPIMQAVLLCEYYARFRGRNKKAYQPSPRFKTLYQMVMNMHTKFATDLASCDDSQQWNIWVNMESIRRLLSACFLLDVHGMAYLEQHRVLDYASPETLPIPLSVGTAQFWEAQTVQEWRTMGQPTVLTTEESTQLVLSAEYIGLIPPFDASLLLATHALRLRQRQSLTKVDLLENASSINTKQFSLVSLFPFSPSAMTYLALHHTPLHTLLSVSGDSWVFNKKVLQASAFAEHKRQLENWRDSGSAAVATAFAARSLNLFLGLQLRIDEDGSAMMPYQLPGPQYRDISDFWGVYVCALICWAFGHVELCRTDASRPSRSTAMQWIVKAANMEPGQIQSLSQQERQIASGAIGLARASLERDCLGGRNMLLADALGVLRKLEEGDSHRRF